MKRTCHLSQESLARPQMGATGLEPVTPSVSSKGMPDTSETRKGLAKRTSDACTNACTSEAEKANVGTVEALAAALLSLSAVDRVRIAALLTSKQAEQAEGNGATP